MAKNNVYPLVIPPGCGYPMFVPVHPSKSKPKWLPYGRTPPQILPVGGGESYFERRSKPASSRADDQSESYPRRVDLLNQPTDGEF